ncbi:MAG: glycerol-3-phosphate acyltransferase, partial [candidate division Zixibacteria bacterium]
VLFIVIVALTRYVSLGSLLAVFFISGSILIERYYLDYPIGGEIIGLIILLMTLALYTHRANIGRLLSGTENRIGKKKGIS